MANTYTQIYIHCVFVVKFREHLVRAEHREELQKFMAGIVRNHNHKLLAIYCMPDHTHMFVGMRPDEALSDLMREVKASSSAFVNEKKWNKSRFNWQVGFGAFSHSHAEIDRVIKYILNQAEHHRRRAFSVEYLEMLRKSNIEYDERYLFDRVQD